MSRISRRQNESNSDSSDKNISDDSFEEDSAPKVPLKTYHFSPESNSLYLPELFCNNDVYIERYQCGLCSCICDNPRYQYCGCDQAFCYNCLQNHYKYSKNRCPICKKETKELIPMSSFNESILNLNMICKNSDLKCKWTGKCKDYKDHLSKCPKEIVACPEKKCILKLCREEILIHKHIFSDNNNNNSSIKEVKIQKKNKNKKKLESKKMCPNNCGGSFDKEGLVQHLKECPNAIINCPYENLGCKDKFMVKELEKRLIEDSEKHINLANLAMEEMSLLKKENHELKEIIQNTDKENDINDNKGGKTPKSNNTNILNIQINNYGKGNEININNNFLSKKRVYSDNNYINNDDFDNDESKTFSIFREQYDTPTEKGESSIYSLLESTKGLVSVNNNILEANNLDGKTHHFIFYNNKYNIPKSRSEEFSFRIKLLKDCEWYGVGVCDKIIVKNNKYKYNISNKSGKKSTLGIYMVFSNKLTWNSNNVKQCKKIYYKPSLTKKNTQITCTMYPELCQLDFNFNNEEFISLNDVRCFSSDFFSPCLILLNNGKIETNFDYMLY